MAAVGLRGCVLDLEQEQRIHVGRRNLPEPAVIVLGLRSQPRAPYEPVPAQVLEKHASDFEVLVRERDERVESVGILDRLGGDDDTFDGIRRPAVCETDGGPVDVVKLEIRADVDLDRFSRAIAPSRRNENQLV